jgi:cell wall-associated NlpC family hydrolase
MVEGFGLTSGRIMTKTLLKALTVGFVFWTTAPLLAADQVAATKATPDGLSRSLVLPELRESSSPSVAALRERLVGIGRQLGERTDVPYVWGGSRVGEASDCAACRQCIQTRKVPVGNRLKACGACRSCGVDCSHFVHLAYSRAGLDFPYSPTRMLKRDSRHQDDDLSFVDIGTDLQLAQPGDLLLYRQHVVMLLRTGEAGRGDFVHATRMDGGDRVGGIQLLIDRPLVRFRGKLLKILRHRKLHEVPVADAMAAVFELPSPLAEYLIAEL